MAINWNTTEEEFNIICKIAKRAAQMARALNVEYDTLTAQMDITATHCNGNPLRLQELLDADNTNFAHDIFGIRLHMDRNTGELLNCFVPRFSKPE